MSSKKNNPQRILTQEERDRWERLRSRAARYAQEAMGVVNKDKLNTESEINEILQGRHLAGVFFISGDNEGASPTVGLSLWLGDIQVDLIAVPADFNGETVSEALANSTKLVFSILHLK